MKIVTGLAGLFKFDAHKLDANGEIIESRNLLDWFNNLILDAGLNRIASGAILSRCMVGGSSSAPLVGQTGLVTPIAETTSVFATAYGTDLANGYCYLRRTFRFAQGTTEGNLNEVGVGWASNTCFSRALTVDGSGTPTTISPGADEVLDVTYELRFYWPTGDVTGDVTLDGNVYAFTARADTVGSWQGQLSTYFIGQGMLNAIISGCVFHTGGSVGGLGAITAGPNGSQYLTITPTFNTYSNNSYQRTSQFVYGVSEAQNPISAIRFFSPVGVFKAAFNPAIPKTNTHTLTLGFHFGWARKTI